MKKIITLIAATFMVAGVFVSCKSDKEESIIGKWSLTSVATLAGEVIASGEDVVGFPTIEFTKDEKLNAFVETQFVTTLPLGTYVVSGKLLKITIDEGLLNMILLSMEDVDIESIEMLKKMLADGILIKKLTDSQLQLQPVAPAGLEAEENEIPLLNFTKI